MELQILELPKLPKALEMEEDIKVWMKFFSGKTREEFEQMAKTNEYLEEAYEELLEISADDKKRLEYEARERALKDHNTKISSAEARGKKCGVKIGEKRGIEKTKRIFHLHMQGKSSQEIADLCHIQLKAVEEILQ